MSSDNNLRVYKDYLNLEGLINQTVGLYS